MKKIAVSLLGLLIGVQVMGAEMLSSHSFSAGGYKAGVNITVTINTTTTTIDGLGFVMYAISDIFPQGWTCVSSTPAGTVNTTDHKISWDGTTDPPTTLSYVLAPSGTVDPVIFIGQCVGYADGNVVTGTFPNLSLPLLKAHPADTNGDGKITQLEYVSYAGPVAAVFKRGINGGEYNWDGTTLTPKTSP